MRIPGVKSIEQSARWLRSRFVRGALVLGYHRVAEAAEDPFSMCVTPQHFAEQLEVLRRFTDPISLRDLAENLSAGNLPRRAVVLTLDDGYADALYQAAPLLEKYQVPATVFIATGYLGKTFWWDRLERILLSPESLPDRLSLPINGGVLKWRAGRENDRNANSRHHLLRSVYRQFLLLSAEKRDQMLQQLAAWSGFQADADHDCRVLSGEELIELSDSRLIDIGAHSVTHPFLANLNLTAQQKEIYESKIHLETLLRRPVTTFSYPNGSFSRATRVLVRDCGFRCACTSHNDIARKGSDLLQLPRFWVANRDGEVFSRWLNWWLKEN
jgi:peptidoglycan/xylan/chitin deacetylase (PgdA/CDA1 family)